MFLLLATAVFSLAPQTPQLVTDVQTRIRGTPLVVSLALTDWKDDEKLGAPLRKSLGDKVLFAGTLAPAGSLLTVIAERNDPPAGSKTWRDRLAPPGEKFDIGYAHGVDCSATLAPGVVQSDYHAYITTRTHVFDVHVSRVSDTEKPPFPRAEFERIVKSLHVLALRRGWSEDYPAELAPAMTVAAMLGVDSEQWQKGYRERHPGEWATEFATAEYLRFAKAAPDAQIAAYERALASITKVEKPDAKERFATAILYDGLSLAQYDAAKYAESIAPLEKGLALLEELGRKERSSLAYNLACANALTNHGPQALAALARAIEADPRLRENAAKDADFASVAGTAEFKKLITAPDDKAPARPR